MKIVKSLSYIGNSKFSLHIVVVDNASPDNSYLILKKSFSSNNSVTIIQNEINSGFTGGNNIGIQYLLTHEYDYILLINNDVIIDSNFILPLINTLKKYSDVAAVNPKIYFAPGHEYHKNRYQPQDLGKVIWAMGGKIDWKNIYCSNIGIDEVDSGQFNHETKKIDFITGCCCLLRSSALKRIGLFDQHYFMYMEDADLSMRLINNGFKLMFQPKSIIWHLNAGSSSAGGPLQQYFLTRNRLLFGFKYASLKTKFALLRQALVQLTSSPHPWIKIAVKDFFLNRWSQGSWQ